MKLENARIRLDKARDTFEKSYYALLAAVRIGFAFTEESILARQDNGERMVGGLDLEERGR